MHAINYLESAWLDLRYALRAMRKNLIFTMAAVLTLALGIGGNTAIFTVIHAVLLEPLPYSDPGRLVRLSADYPRRNLEDTTFTKNQFDDIKAVARSFSALGAYGNAPENMVLSGAGQPEMLKGARVSANFLDILKVQPVIGRGFVPEEDKRGGPNVVMISTELWKRRFGSDPQAAGRAITLNATPFTIVGVLPPGFAFPYSGLDFWVTRPSEWSSQPAQFWDISTFILGFGRLKPGVTLQQARAEMDVLNREHLAADTGKTVGRMRVSSLKDQLIAGIRPTLWTLFGAVGFVLLIACANIAGLLLARSNARSREFAVRAAVGAGRGRLVRQLLVESVALSLLGGVFGLLFAKWALEALKYLTAANYVSAISYLGAVNLPRIGEIRIDGFVLAFTFALSVVTGVLFGLFPSLQAGRFNFIDELRESGGAGGLGSPGTRKAFGVNTRSLLMIGQISLSIVLLIAATLLMKSFAHLHEVNPGFQSANLLTGKIALPPAHYNTTQKKRAFFNDLLASITSVPGVRGVTLMMSLPTTAWFRTDIQIEGQPWDPDPANWPTIQIQSVEPGYFRALGIPLRRGRTFTGRDNKVDAAPVIIVNESFARRFWPAYPRGENPVGQHMREGADKTGWVEIVGIVGDVHEGSLAGTPQPEFYVPFLIHVPQTAYIAIRTSGHPLSFANLLRRKVLAIDRNQPVSDLRTMDQVLEMTLGERRLMTWLLGAFAATALLLAVIGMYGLIAYSVAQRTHELGIRRALGAQESDILALVLKRAVMLTAVGVGTGICGSLLLTRVLENLLFHVSATDPTTFAVIAVLFVFVALSAAYIPARHAMRVDPMAALRIG